MSHFSQSKLTVFVVTFTLPSLCSGLTIQTIGTGSAVSSVDRAATFDGLNYQTNGIGLSDYTENQIIIGTSGDSLAGWGPGVRPYFDPFHVPGIPDPTGFTIRKGARRIGLRLKPKMPLPFMPSSFFTAMVGRPGTSTACPGEIVVRMSHGKPLKVAASSLRATSESVRSSP